MKQDNNLTVLIVEDEPDMASMLKMLLERKFSATVEIAEDRASAREKLESGTFDIITLDYQLPDGDGLELLREINEMDNPTPVIMVTGHGDEQTAVKSFKLGAIGYVVKDKRLSTLLTDAVEHALSEIRLRHAEVELQKSEEKYRLLAENATDVIWTTDMDMNWTYMSPSVEHVRGYTVEEAMSQTLEEVSTPESFKHTMDVLAEELEADKERDPDRVRTLEVEQYRKDGSTIWASVAMRFLRDDDGNIVGILGVSRNTTDRKRMEESLKESEENLTIIFDSVPGLIFYKDRENNFIKVNRALADSMGLTKEEMEGKSLFDLFPEEQAEEYWKDDLQVIESGMPKMGIIEPMETSEGTMWFRTDKVLYKDEEDNTVGIIGFAVDITERKRVEEALREEKAFTEDTLNSLKDAFYVLGMDGRFLRWNKAVTQTTGYSDGEISSMTVQDFYETSSEQRQQAFLETLIKEGHASIEENIITKDGRLIPYYISATLLKDHEGNPTAVCAVGRDITERKKHEEELRKSEEKFRFMTESMNDIAYTVDMELNTTYVSENIENILGFSTEERMKQSLYEQITPESLEFVGKRIAEELQRDGEEGVDPDRKVIEEVDYCHKDGSIVTLETTASFIRDEEGNPVGIYGLARDVSERKQWEEELKESEERYRLILNMSFIGVIINDGTDIVYVNDKFLEITGYPREHFKGRGEALELLVPEEFEVVNDNVYRTLKGESVDQPYDVKMVRSDGKIIQVQLITSLISLQGRPAVLTIIQDVTERKKAEEEIKRINTELEGYAHTVSHDLKGPLSGIMLCMEMLADSLEGVDTGDAWETSEIVAIIDRNARNAQGRINDLLALAESGQEPRETSPVDVGEVVEGILGERSHEIKEKGIEVDVSGDLGTVIGNPTQVRQVFSNLVRNAIRYNDSEDPVIRISHLGDDEDGGHRYLVRDNGPGIPREIIDQVFLPFTRGESGDTGIGLSIVERVVKVYGGQIRAYNDNGACFEFVLRGL